MATRCNTLQRAATRCNTLQHAATDHTLYSTPKASQSTSTLQWVAKDCAGLHCVALPKASWPNSVLQWVAVRCSALQLIAVCRSTLQLGPPHIFWASAQPTACTARPSSQCVAMPYSVVLCVTLCCSVLQCVAVCCSMLQCVAVCCSVLLRCYQDPPDPPPPLLDPPPKLWNELPCAPECIHIDMYVYIYEYLWM